MNDIVVTSFFIFFSLSRFYNNNQRRSSPPNTQTYTSAVVRSLAHSFGAYFSSFTHENDRISCNNSSVTLTRRSSFFL